MAPQEQRDRTLTRQDEAEAILVPYIVGVLPLTYRNRKSKLLPTQLLADSLKTPSRPLDQPTFLPDVRQRTYLLDRQFKMDCIHGCPVGRDMEISTMKTLKFALLAAGLLAAAPAFAQTAGGTANTGPQGSGNFVAGKPEGSGNFVAGKPEGNGNFVAGKPEGNGNFVAGKPKDPAK
jgi:hypothetical protein